MPAVGFSLALNPTYGCVVGWVEASAAKPNVGGAAVHSEAVEARPTSKPGRGLVRTSNRVVNQRGETVLAYNPLRMLKGRM